MLWGDVIMTQLPCFLYMSNQLLSLVSPLQAANWATYAGVVTPRHVVTGRTLCRQPGGKAPLQRSHTHVGRPG